MAQDTEQTAEHSQAGVGTAHLSSALEDDGPYTIHGVALGAGDVTLGGSGIKKKWPGEELKKGAETLAGQPLVRDHQNDSDGTIGTVTKATYKEGVGVLYEAEIAPHYEQYARDIASGILEVSARAYHDPVSELEKDEDTDALKTRNIVFDNLSVVSQGASPSNTAEIGEATALAEGPGGDAVAVMEQGAPRMEAAELAEVFEADAEENRHPGHDRQDESAMPRSDVGNTPEWEDGDMVRWQVEPDLFGKIVHVDEEKNVAMVEIMGMEDGSMTSTGFTITAGFSDIKPMKVPESKSDLEGMWKDDEDEEMSSSPDSDTVDELAEVAGLDINGIVMWGDDNMGVLSDFMEDDGTLMAEIDVLEREDGAFTKTGETVTAPLEDTESMTVSHDGAVAELEAAWHTPEWDGLDEDGEWSKPAMEDFDTDDMSEIDDHFIVSKTGEWPPENYGDLALPVVSADGDLSLDALDSAHQMAPQMDGVSDDMANELQSKINSWAKEHFDQAVAGEEMADNQADDRSVTVATTMDDDARSDTNGQSTRQIAALRVHKSEQNMTQIDYTSASEDAIDDLSEPVVMEEAEVEELREKAERADELDDRLDDVNSTLDELASNQETLDSVDSEQIEELREYDDATVLSGEEYEELTELVDEVGGIFASELADHSPFSEDELSERFTPMELREKVEEHDEASVQSELSNATETDAEPEGGSASSEELEQSDEDAQTERTTEELREAVASRLEEDGLNRQADKVRDGDISLDEMGIDPDGVEQ